MNKDLKIGSGYRYSTGEQPDTNDDDDTHLDLKDNLV